MYACMYACVATLLGRDRCQLLRSHHPAGPQCIHEKTFCNLRPRASCPTPTLASAHLLWRQSCLLGAPPLSGPELSCSVTEACCLRYIYIYIYIYVCVTYMHTMYVYISLSLSLSLSLYIYMYIHIYIERERYTWQVVRPYPEEPLISKMLCSHSLKTHPFPQRAGNEELCWCSRASLHLWEVAPKDALPSVAAKEVVA
jgi:hypothetical protein